MTTPRSAPEARAGAESLSVAAAAALVGVAPSTLRTWARRYGLEPSGHRTGVHRRYSDVDVARLQLMRSLTRAGMTSKDAAERARAAGVRDLALAAVDPVDAAGRSDLAAAPAAGDRAAAGLEPAVRTLLATVGRGDARGAASLLRLAIRELGAARAFDERVLAARTALWLLPPGVRERSARLLTASVEAAVGEVELRREPRNTAAVAVGHLAGDEDPAAMALARAALGERSLRCTAMTLPGGELHARQRLSGATGGAGLVLALHLGPDPGAARLAARLRSCEEATVVLWGDGWVHWPGQSGTLADVVRAVEALATTEA